MFLFIPDLNSQWKTFFPHLEIIPWLCIVFFLSLLICRLINFVYKKISYNALTDKSCLIKITTIPYQCFWSCTLQKDGKLQLEIIIDFNALNTSPNPLRFLNYQILPPKYSSKISWPIILPSIKKIGTHFSEPDLPILSNFPTKCRINAFIEMDKKPKIDFLDVTFKITDETGYVHNLKARCKKIG